MNAIHYLAIIGSDQAGGSVSARIFAGFPSPGGLQAGVGRLEV